MKLVLTCEHGGNTIPKEYAFLFKEHQAVLNSHKGYDLGSLDLFESLKPLSDFSFSSETSRLLIELNRSLHHNKLFSEFVKPLTKKEKEEIINHYYLDYRNKVEKTIKSFIQAGQKVLHLSIHSFTPILNNKERYCDIGLLFDSTKPEEKEYCKNFKKNILNRNSNYRIRYNYPYLGKADGFTTYLRKQFPENYLGVELEVNQKYVKKTSMDRQLKQVIGESLKETKIKVTP